MNIVVLVNERPEGRAALDWALLNGIHLPSVNDDPVVHVVLESTGDSLARPSYISPALTEEITAQLRAAGVKPRDPLHSGRSGRSRHRPGRRHRSRTGGDRDAPPLADAEVDRRQPRTTDHARRTLPRGRCQGVNRAAGRSG